MQVSLLSYLRKPTPRTPVLFTPSLIPPSSKHTPHSSIPHKQPSSSTRSPGHRARLSFPRCFFRRSDLGGWIPDVGRVDIIRHTHPIRSGSLGALAPLGVYPTDVGRLVFSSLFSSTNLLLDSIHHSCHERSHYAFLHALGIQLLPSYLDHMASLHHSLSHCIGIFYLFLILYHHCSILALFLAAFSETSVLHKIILLVPRPSTTFGNECPRLL